MNRAMPIDNGTANTRAMIDVTNVPKTKARLPNLPSFGAHRLEKRKPPASSLKIGHASLVVE